MDARNTGALIRALREERGLSQSELARRTGVTRQTIISLEKGSYVPSLLFALNLCEVFDAAVEDVFSKEEQS